MSDKLLEVKNLSVEYDTEISTVYAVNGLDLDLNYGETLGLVGETGAGKTTTALSVIQLLPEGIGFVTDGSIKLDGVDMLNAPEEKIRAMRGSVVSMIFQDPMSALNPVMTVGAQIMEVLKIHHPEQSTAQLEARVDEMMELVGIPAKRKVEYPHQFSGGMKQRIVIAIALACEPKLILADEPTTALDVTIQAQMLGLINELQKRLNTAMILITHDLGVVAQTCEKVMVMYAGEAIEYGTAEDIFETTQRHPYTQGLFNAIPKLDENTKRLEAIEGMMADPTQKIEGCRFADRCKYATRNSLDFVEELADMGVYMQINADSITGKDGFFAKRYCNKIMKDGLLHFVGSDCHNSAKRSSRIGEAYRMVSAKFGQDYADELFIHNPAEILKQKQKHEATD